MNKKLIIINTLFSLLGVSSIQAANFLYNCGGRPVGYASASLSFSASSAGFPAGQIWDQALRVAISRVNENPSRFRITSLSNNDDSVAIGNGQSEIWWSSNPDESNPAVAYTRYQCNTSTGVGSLIESDILFYNKQPYGQTMTATDLWGYGGGFRPFQTTAIHELGHAMGLAHSNSEYNIMGTDWLVLTTNGGVARSYLGTDANYGLLRIYGTSPNSIQDLSLSHWKYLGPDGAYSDHERTRMFNASGSELSSTLVSGEKKYSINKGETVGVQLTAENNGQVSQSARVGYYISTDNTITTSDRLLTTESRNIGLNDPLTYIKNLVIPTDLASGDYWLGAIIDDNNLISEIVEANNATRIPVSLSGGTGVPPVAGECTETRLDELGRNCSRSNLSARQGTHVNFYARIPSGISRLTITSSGIGTGDADLYYNPFSWAYVDEYTASSTGSTNEEILVINNPPTGFVYISLYGYTSFSGAKVTLSY